MSLIGPQVIRRRDDEYVVLNADLESLTVPQRVVLGIEIWEQVRTLMLLNGEEAGDWRVVDKLVASIVGAPHTTLTRMREFNGTRPDLVEAWGNGEMTLIESLRAAGRKVRIKVGDGGPSRGDPSNHYFGKGDKFDAAIEPLRRYLRVWEKKDFRYTHINPKEARSRLKKLNDMLIQLEKTKEDLERRSRSATLSAPPEKKRGEA